MIDALLREMLRYHSKVDMGTPEQTAATNWPHQRF
jgi:hypothetical protein